MKRERRVGRQEKGVEVFFVACLLCVKNENEDGLQRTPPSDHLYGWTGCKDSSLCFSWDPWGAAVLIVR